MRFHIMAWQQLVQLGLIAIILGACTVGGGAQTQRTNTDPSPALVIRTETVEVPERFFAQGRVRSAPEQAPAGLWVASDQATQTDRVRVRLLDSDRTVITALFVGEQTGLIVSDAVIEALGLSSNDPHIITVTAIDTYLDVARAPASSTAEPISTGAELFVEVERALLSLNADFAETRLREAGFTSVRRTISENGLRYHQILVGPVETVAEHVALLRNLHAAGFPLARPITF